MLTKGPKLRGKRTHVFQGPGPMGLYIERGLIRLLPRQSPSYASRHDGDSKEPIEFLFLFSIL